MTFDENECYELFLAVDDRARELEKPPAALSNRALKNVGTCHNGISGKLTTRPIDGCAFGFYPCSTRYSLKAGLGGVR